MTQEEQEAQTNTVFDAVFDKFAKETATPLFVVGIGHAPGPAAGKFVLHLVGNFPLAEAYTIITAIREDVAARLDTDPDGVS